METFKINEYTFRLKKMNAIDVLAIQTQVRMNSVENSRNFFKTALENIEVQVTDDKWLPVKMDGREIYNPEEVTENASLLNELISHFLTELEKVFQKSNESKV